MRIYIFSFVPFLVGVLALYLMLDGNHHAIDMRWAWPFLLLAVVVSPFFLTRKQCVMLLVCCLIIYAVILLADHFNVLVDYTRWLKRGMPEPFNYAPFKQ